MERKFTTVSIPKPLADKANDMIKKTGFTSLSSFVEYLLRELVSEGGSSKKHNRHELASVEDKLRNLGYM
ncbi:ribbon-helix-helix domain-containing protein [Candidatus Parvarchaeota archaeon]|nr:ribbon-helix-helix domain-containing protein [Candidatus Parvarchaeota archaeon]